jgi:glutamine synthetase
MTTVNEILDAWKAQGIAWIRFELPDLHGTARVKLVPLDAAYGFAAGGLNMYGGAQVLDSRSDVVPGSLYNTETSYADQMLFPDPATAQVLPWAPATGRLICSAFTLDGRPQLASPRQLLAHVLDQAAAMGYGIRSGAEYENYFFNADGSPLFGGYHIFNPVRNTFHPVVQDLLDSLPAVGVDLITANAEYGPGQFEINWGPGDGLVGPDKAYTYKNAVKEIAHRHGLIGTFMSKPITGMAGSGAHFHVSLIDAGTGRSLMGDDADPQGINDLTRHFIGGNLAYAKAAYSLLAPTVNCYKRRRPHTFAPSNISWGLEDRSSLIRIKGTTESSRHVEHRAPSGLSNPYVMAAAVVACGILGIRDGIDPGAPSGPTPAEDDPRYEGLPWTLREALDAFEACAPLRAILGEEFSQVWLAVRRYELARYEDHVTDWERNEYLEIY